jgi:hypothetical protein
MQLPIRLGCAVSLVRIALHTILLCTSLALRSFVGKSGICGEVPARIDRPGQVSEITVFTPL